MNYILSSIFILFCSSMIVCHAQEMAIPEPLDCYTSEFKGLSILRENLTSKNLRQPPGSQIDVEFVDFPEDAKLAFNLAVEIWEGYIVSTIPIKIKATWSGDLATNTLAQSSASRIVRNFRNAPYSDVWYPIPLAEALASREINDGESDINIAMNRRVNWFTSLEGTPRSSQYDLVSIALHEIAHGLGFSSSFKITDNQLGTWGQSEFPYVYDLFVQSIDQQRLVSPGKIANPSNDLLQLMESNQLFFDILDPILGKELPKLQSLSPFELGRSISHLDEQAYPNGNENSLMTPNIRPGELIRQAGIRALSVLEQIGWTIKNISSERPLAQTENQNSVLLFPSPAIDKLKIYAPTDWIGQTLSYQILDISGRSFLKNDVILTSTSFEINIGKLTSGGYLIVGNSKDEKFSKRFVKL